MSKYKILGVFTGQVATLNNGVASAITNHPRSKIILKKHGIDTDEVENQKHHGGDMRVVHHYSVKNYNFLKNKFPEIAAKFVGGSIGENILTEELTESELNIGDIYQLGSAKVQLTVSRRPCATINYAYQDDRILKAVMETGRTGWFYRVLEEGIVEAGDYLEFLESPFPNMPVSKLYDQGYGKTKFSDLEFLKKCFDTGLMDKGWKPKIIEALGILNLN